MFFLQCMNIRTYNDERRVGALLYDAELYDTGGGVCVHKACHQFQGA